MPYKRGLFHTQGERFHMETTPSTPQSATTTAGAASLRRNAIGLPGVLFQSITTMAPASAVAFSLGAAIPFAGGALPLAVVLALLVCSLIALNIGALARHLPSAGGYFTYVGRALGVHAGWMTGWLFSLTYLLIVPLQLLVLGPVADSFTQQYFHFSWGWAVWAMIFAVVFTLWPGIVYGPTNGFALLGTIITILILLVYMATCVAVPFFYWREHRAQFNVLRHIVVPIVPAIILIFPIYAQFVPAPPFPLNLAGPICAAWLIVGLIVVTYLGLRKRTELEAGDKLFIDA